MPNIDLRPLFAVFCLLVLGLIAWLWIDQGATPLTVVASIVLGLPCLVIGWASLPTWSYD